MITLPGLIDPHTHPRGLPSDEYKEDFYSATSAALAGGFTTIFDMPNNPYTPTLTYDLLVEKQKIAQEKILCDIGFFFGSTGKNFDDFPKVTNISYGLKIFLSHSTGNLIIDLETFKTVCEKWPSQLPILLHAEEDLLGKALEIITQTQQRTHICHVSSKYELEQVFAAKEKGITVTCGVTPHHLFLNIEDMNTLNELGTVKPELKHKSDVDFLWQHLSAIDVIESDHAPHTLEEKQSTNPPFGFPGLETTLPLLLTAVSNNKLTLQDLTRLCYDGPAEIFGVQKDAQTYIEVDENEDWVIKNEDLKTKCRWSPFNSWKVKGKVKRVFLRGTKVFENGNILAEPGSGKILTHPV